MMARASCTSSGGSSRQCSSSPQTGLAVELGTAAADEAGKHFGLVVVVVGR
jgi:hypothetical protein